MKKILFTLLIFSLLIGCKKTELTPLCEATYKARVHMASERYLQGAITKEEILKENKDAWDAYQNCLK